MKQIKKKIKGQQFIFDYRKAIYWEDTSSLILSDVHVGKLNHFQKNGIPIPSDGSRDNLVNIKNLVNEYDPTQIYILGDLFHSSYNKEWDDWLIYFSKSEIKFTLILGNHDQYDSKKILNSNITLMNQLNTGPFLFTHIPVKGFDEFNICGHVHPAVKLRGLGRQYMKLNCFYISDNQLILPAFGTFTGSHILKPNKTDHVICLTSDGLFEL
tara:strand:- start:164 stop:799 length:636 start_codon:yes stop_codon:yes gene_type:complete